MGAILVMYHYVRDPDPRQPGIAAIGMDDFAGQVEHLLRHYEPLEPDALLAAVRDGMPIPDGFVLTFDDGVRDHYDNAAPVLERHGIHGIFAPIGLPYLHHKIPFVQKNQLVRGRLGEDGVADAYVEVAEEVAPEAAAAVESAPIGEYRRGSEKYLKFKYASNRLIPREVSEAIMSRLFAQHVSEDEVGYIDELYMTQGEIIDLRRRGHSIAGHSISHPSLPQLDEADQEREINAAKAWLELMLDEPLAWWNYPYGDHDERSERVCERLGLEIAYSTRPPIDWVSLDDRFRVPRVDTVFLPTSADADPVELHGEVV
jgi:peptidoglycan/xylan/chitin deacetylase (PgdA/CDA1 family)